MHWEHLTDYPLGSGSFGCVKLGRYKPYPQHFGYRYIAVKTISSLKKDSEGATKSFEREVATLRRLDHPNIVQFLGTLFMFSQRVTSASRSRIA